MQEYDAAPDEGHCLETVLKVPSLVLCRRTQKRRPSISNRRHTPTSLSSPMPAADARSTSATLAGSVSLLICIRDTNREAVSARDQPLPIGALLTTSQRHLHERSLSRIPSRTTTRAPKAAREAGKQAKCPTTNGRAGGQASFPLSRPTHSPPPSTASPPSLCLLAPFTSAVHRWQYLQPARRAATATIRHPRAIGNLACCSRARDGHRDCHNGQRPGRYQRGGFFVACPATRPDATPASH